MLRNTASRRFVRWTLAVGAIAVAAGLLAGTLATGAGAAEKAKAKKGGGRPALAQPTAEEEARAMSDPRLQWYREAKFGMFIHWGLYAAPAGTWKGEQVAGVGEWIMNRAKIPVAEYEQLAKQFNPVKFDAEQWAQLAQDAGMRYMTITSKHHDGFAMFHSKVSKYNIVDATPWGRDPMKELAAACAKRGIKFCFYYSQAQDWHEPNGAGNTWDFGPDDKKDFDQYLRDKALPQVRELLTQYGPLGLVWFDTPRLMTAERAADFTKLVYQVQPNCLVNGRLGGAGDYRSEGDNRIPNEVIRGVWETPATMNDTWGYKSYDHNFKSVDDILFKLVDIVSKGGNYLLNVGPTAEGVIPAESVSRLRAVGQWLKVNAAAVYGTRPTPFGAELHEQAWRCTTKPGKLFIHLFQWPQGSFVLNGLQKPLVKAYLLVAPDKPLAVKQAAGTATVSLPAEAPDKLDSVLVLETE